MRINFNILGIDDQPGRIIAQLNSLKIIIKNYGFNLKYEIAESIDKAKDYISNDPYSDNIDLVLMDHDLGKGPTGLKGLKLVKAKFPYKEIIYYSATDTEKLEKNVFDEKILGVFCCPRELLVDTAKGVFETLVKKVLDIEHCRGIAIGASCDVESLIKHYIKKTFEIANAENKDMLFNIIDKQLIKIDKRFCKVSTLIKKSRDISEILEQYSVYTSVHFVKLFREILKMENKPKTIQNLIKNYQVNIIPMRNCLAHQEKEEDGFSVKIKDRKKEEFTSERMQDLRTNLIKCHETLEDLISEQTH